MAAPPKPPPPSSPPRGNTTSPSADVGKIPVLEKIEPKFLPPRIILNAVEAFGKTSCGAYAPSPAILMAKGETGYETLLGAGSVPSVPTVRLETWEQTLALVSNLAKNSSSYKTLVLDAMSGFERMCHEYVCQTQFKGDWGDKGFMGYHKGYDLSIGEWIKLLGYLDAIHDQGICILMTSHCRIKNFKNPLGPDFDRFESDVHPKTWDVTKRNVDAVFFGNFVTIVDEDKGSHRKRGIGRTDRVVYTTRRDAFDAKNRYGMDDEIDIPDDPAKIWPTLWEAIKGSKEKAKGDE